jgi:hypothetical protein
MALSAEDIVKRINTFESFRLAIMNSPSIMEIIGSEGVEELSVLSYHKIYRDYSLMHFFTKIKLSE